LNQVIQNFQKKRRIELLVESQKGTMDKFIKVNKKWIRKYKWVFFDEEDNSIYKADYNNINISEGN